MELVELGKIKELVCANLPIEVENLGKMIRSRVGLYFLKGLNIQLDEKFLKFLTVVELIHNASLFHDDVIDNEQIRRDKPSLNSVYGNKSSILYGNIALSNATDILLELGYTELISEMNNCVKKMCFGELMQQGQFNNIPKLEDYLEKTKLKTASLFEYMMFGLSLLSGGKYRAEFVSFADSFGMGFQISNDLADYLKGLENSDDIGNGVYTAPIIYSQSVKIDSVAIDKTKGLIDNYLERAIAVLDEIGDNFDNDCKTALIGVIKCLRI